MKFKSSFILIFSVETFLIVSTIYIWKIYATETSNIYLLVIAVVVLVLVSMLIFFLVKRKHIDISIKSVPLLATICISLIISNGIWQYITTFSFEKWAEKEYLRQFMVADFITVQSFPNNNLECDYLMSKYTRQQANALLNTGKNKNKIPDITYEFVDSSAGRFSCDIYYGYTGLNGKEYWLVLGYFGTDPNIKTDVSSAEIVLSGSKIEKGKSIFVEE